MTVQSTAPAAPQQMTYVIRAVIVAFVLSFAIIAGSLLVFNGDVPVALGVGLFTAFWGGPGFGLIAGIALYNLRVERHSRLATADA